MKRFTFIILLSLILVTSEFYDDPIPFNVPTNKIWVRGGGATAVGTFMRNIIPAVNMVNVDSFVTFSQLGTSRGLCRLMNYSEECLQTDVQKPFNLDFSISTRGIRLQDRQKYQDLAVYPFAASPVAIVHSVKNLTAPLILSREIIARIFRKCDLNSPINCFDNDIRRWDHPEILELNPGQEDTLRAAGDILLNVRNDSAAVTAGVKNALSVFEEKFRLQIDLANHDPDSSKWRSVNATKIHGLDALTAILTVSSNIISYLPLENAKSASIQVVGITMSNTSRDNAVFPNLESTTRAVLEKGMNYQIESDDLSSRAVILSGATNQGAYPIVIGAYFVIRLNTLSNNSTCKTRVQILNFAKFLFSSYENKLVQDLAQASSLVMMPKDILIESLNHIRDNFKCQGILVSNLSLESLDILNVELRVPQALELVFQTIGTDIMMREHLSDDSSITQLDVHKMNSNTPSQNQIVLGLPFKNSPNNVLSIPYMMMAFVVRYNLCGITFKPECASPLDLTPRLVADIFSGKITKWNHEDIQSRNPHHLLPDLSITVFSPPNGPWRNLTQEMIRNLTSNQSFEFVQTYNFDVQLQFVNLHYSKGSIMIAPVFADELLTNDEQTFVASINGILPTTISLSSDCVVLDEDSMTYFPDVSNSKCYLLLSQINLIISKVLEECSKRVYRNAGGLLGWSSFTKPTVESSLVYLVRELLSFPARGSSVEQVEASARESSSFPIREKVVARALLSFHATPLFEGNQRNIKELRAKFLQNILCESDLKFVVQSENLNLIPMPLVYLGFGLAGVSILFYFCLGVWVLLHQERKIVKFASPRFLLEVLFGAAFNVSTIFLLSMQEYKFNRDAGHDLEELNLLDRTCAGIPWVYSIGYVIIYSALIMKTWRLVKIFSNPKMRKFQHLKDIDLFKNIGLLILLFIFLNIIWYLGDRLHWERFPTEVSADRLTIYSSVGFCTTEGNPWIAVGPLLAVTFLLMIVGLILCFQARGLPSEFQESSWISFCLILQFQCLLFVIPILNLTSNVVVNFLAKIILILINSTGTVLLIFIPKLWMMHGWNAPSSSSFQESKEKQRAEFKGEPRPNQQDRSFIKSVEIFRSSNNNNQVLGIVSPSHSELVKITENTTLHDSSTPISHRSNLFKMLTSPETLYRFREKLIERRMEEGLEFFIQVVERDRIGDEEKRKEATLKIMRDFIIPTASHQTNLPSHILEKLIDDCFAVDQKNMLSENFFHSAAVLSLSEVSLSLEFSKFIEEEKKRGNKLFEEN